MVRQALGFGLVWGLVWGLSASGGIALAHGDTVNVYSLRQLHLLQPVLDAFTAETGTKVRVVYANSGLVERLKREGRSSRADLLISNDFTKLVAIQQAGLTERPSIQASGPHGDAAGSAEQGEAALTQEGTPLTQDGTALTQDGAPLTQDGAALTQDGTALTQDGAALTQEGAALTQDGTALTQEGAALTQDGAALTQDGAALTQDWVALTQRARVIFATTSVAASIEGYADLAEPGKYRVCTRSGLHPYNLALYGFLIEIWGAEEFRKWLTGIKANLGRRPQGNDRDQIRAIAAGICDVSIGNSYYFVRMQQDPAQREFIEGLAVVFPSVASGGTAMNVSGVALLRHARNKQAANALIAYLRGKEAQRFFVSTNFEYPTNPNVSADPALAAIGTPTVGKQGVADYNAISRNQRVAMTIVIETRFDQ
ncbi:MAG: extracellular solute-binding protein [Alphaproteobacteria bacterium]|nr:extracellular solute-binding protein [Alphaproteobacteria bacterium]